MVSFCAFPVIFIDTNFQKGHPNQKGVCPDTLDTRHVFGRFRLSNVDAVNCKSCRRISISVSTMPWLHVDQNCAAPT